MQMTDDPSPLPRTPSRGFRDKPQRNYSAFDRHAPIFSTNVTFLRMEASAGDNNEWLPPIVDRSLRWSECAGCHGTGRVRAPTEEPL